MSAQLSLRFLGVDYLISLPFARRFRVRSRMARRHEHWATMRGLAWNIGRGQEADRLRQPRLHADLPL